MAEVLQPVDDAQLVELSYYLAHLPAFSAEVPAGDATDLSHGPVTFSVETNEVIEAKDQ
jgi:hypothetical protein